MIAQIDDDHLLFFIERSVNSICYCNDYLLVNLYFLSSSLKQAEIRLSLLFVK